MQKSCYSLISILIVTCSAAIGNKEAMELFVTREHLHAQNYSAAPIKVTALKVNPAEIGIALSLSKNTHERGGMHYDKINIYRLLKDGSMVYATTDPNTMRDDLLSLAEHQTLYHINHPHVDICAVSGWGNLIMDGYLAGYSDQEVIMRDDEPPHRTYFSLLVFSDGRLDFRDIRYEHNKPIDAHTGEVLTDSDNALQIASGQPVVKNGVPIPASTIFQQFDNIKHLFHLPFIQQERRTIHFAVDQLINDRAKLKEAAVGSPVTVNLTAYQIKDNIPEKIEVSAHTLRLGLIEKGYRAVMTSDDVKQAGDFYINEQTRKITICFRPALNAHHFIGIDNAGYFLNIIVEGRSNREGINLEEAGAWLIKNYDIKHAIVIDNGADPMLMYEEKLIVPSFIGRTKIASAILYYKKSK